MDPGEVGEEVMISLASTMLFSSHCQNVVAIGFNLNTMGSTLPPSRTFFNFSAGPVSQHRKFFLLGESQSFSRVTVTVTSHPSVTVVTSLSHESKSGQAASVSHVTRTDDTIMLVTP